VARLRAALKWVMPSLRSSSQIRDGSTRGRQTCVAPPADTAHGKHQQAQLVRARQGEQLRSGEELLVPVVRTAGNHDGDPDRGESATRSATPERRTM